MVTADIRCSQGQSTADRDALAVTPAVQAAYIEAMPWLKPQFRLISLSLVLHPSLTMFAQVVVVVVMLTSLMRVLCARCTTIVACLSRSNKGKKEERKKRSEEEQKKTTLDSEQRGPARIR